MVVAAAVRTRPVVVALQWRQVVALVAKEILVVLVRLAKITRAVMQKTQQMSDLVVAVAHVALVRIHLKIMSVVAAQVRTV